MEEILISFGGRFQAQLSITGNGIIQEYDGMAQDIIIENFAKFLG